MLNLLFEQYPALIGTAFAVALILWPRPKQSMVELQRQARLAELKDGAEERYFEERRELETYGPRSAGPFRFGGFLLLGLSLALLVL